MQEFIRIGVELSEGFFQVHALEREGSPAVKRKLSRARFLAFFAGIAPCRIGMEACGPAHHWARELRAMGHEVALIAPAYVKPYLKRGKTDANDAAAICEAMSRPGMRFVPAKSADQQAMLMVHKTRDLLIKQRTMSVNALRGHLSEFGLVAAKGIHRVKALIVLAQAQDRLPEPARQATGILATEIKGLDARIDELEAQIARASAANPVSRLLDEIPAFGPLIASAMVAFHPDPRVFRSAAIFPLRWGSRPASIRAAERRGSAPSPRKATATCARCWWSAAPPFCGSPTNTRARSPNGSSRCGRESPSASSRSRSPTSLPGSPGR